MSPGGSSSRELGNGAAIPLLGLGTWAMSGEGAYRAVLHALETGYRHIDTATIYANEQDVGRALAESGLPRHEVFVTTKLPRERAGREGSTIEQSLQELRTDHVDLWLVHWPPAGALVEVWEALQQVRDEGMARAIGVSNYSPEQIDELVAATGEAPAVNQIPWSPSLHEPGLLAAHRQRGVVLEGYSPLRRSDLGHPVLVGIAGERGMTPAQVVLRWHLEHGIVAIPKSATPERIEENFAILTMSLSADEVDRIDAIAG